MTGRSETEPAVRVSGLSKIYSDSNAGALLGNFGRSLLGRSLSGTKALSGIDFSVAPGEAIGIVGRNGSGKSTLLQILSGALRPTSGECIVRGRLGTLLDLTSGINPEYTGAENALVLGMLAGLSRSEVRARLSEIRAFSGLGDAFDRPVRGYSSGMVMRLGFSAAIHSDPEVLLIDEALAVGDAFYQQRCLRKMRALRDEGVTIVLVTHDPSAVISLCDRAIWLEGGKILEQGSPKDVLRLYLAARYQDDCELGGALEPAAPLEEGEEVVLRAARPIERLDERFGDGRACVSGFEIRDAKDEARTTVRPGEVVQVVLTIEAKAELANPIVGFTMRNRLGDVVTATNTENEGISVPPLSAGTTLDIAFRFQWPSFVSGPLTFSPAVADGSIAAHVMCDWVENALIVSCENERGLFGWWTLQEVEVFVSRLRGDGDEPATDQPARALSNGASEAEEVPEDLVEFSLDEPRDPRVEASNLTEERELLFSGWSFATSGERVEIAIQVQGREEVLLETGGFREDVARAYPDVPHANRSGFSALVPMPAAAGKTHCRVEVRTPDSSRVAADFEIDVPPSPRLVEEDDPSQVALRSLEPGARPRVLFVTHSLNLEGAPRSLFEMATGLAQEAFDVRVLSPVDGPLGGAWKDAGVELSLLPVDVRVGGRDDYDAMIRRLAGLISVGRPDVIVANTLETFWAVHVARELGIESLWIVRESEEPAAYFHSRLPTRIAERGVHALALANRVVFVAEATRALFRTRLPPDRSLVIPNGLDLGRIDAAVARVGVEAIRKTLGIGNDDPLLLCVGTPCARKAQLELIEALAISKTRGLEFRCVFLGVTECDYLDRMRAAIERHALSDHVVLVPPTPEPLPYFAAADLVACPSMQESLPRVVLEAMALAKPIVAANIFGVPELIRGGREGVLVPAGDVEALARAIESVIGDPERARELGRRARLRVEERFTLDRCVDAYALLLRDLFREAQEGDGPGSV